MIATALGEPVYRKVGFVTESRYHYFKDVNLQDLIISEKIIQYHPKFTEEIFKLDGIIIGENRSQHLEDLLIDSFVFIENGIIEGVYFKSFGDGLIVAHTGRAGIELMKKRFQTFTTASFPEENKVAYNFVLSTDQSMPWKPEGLFNRVGGNIG